MIKNFRYIFNKILIGVGIALILSFLRGNFLLGVSAKEISTIWAPYQNNTSVVSNLSSSVTFNFNHGYWANWGFGHLRFNFSIIKVSGDPTAPLVVVKQVGMNNYVCDVGTTTIGNSTFTGQTYSVTCPMIMGSDGLDSMTIFLESNQQNSQANFRITLGGLFTFEKVDDTNIDFSSTNNTINNQTTSINNNQNTNTNRIINNDNTNTKKITDAQKETTDSVEDLTEAITDDHVNQTMGNSFFSDFQSDSHGLSGIITAPIRLLNSLSSSTCSPLIFPLPFVNNNVSLPCMSSIYSSYFPTFLTLYQLITTGLIGYWVLIKLFGHVKGMQDPKDDRIEVLDL